MPIHETDLTIANEALARLAIAPLMAFDEDSDLAYQVAQIYDTDLNALLTRHAWQFARKTVRLDRLDLTPDNGWRYAYQIPGAALGLPVRLLTEPRAPDHPLRDFAVEEGLIFCDADSLWGTFPMRVDPLTWPPYFRHLAVHALAAGLAIPIAQDTRLAAELSAIAFGDPRQGGTGGLFASAALQDASRGGAPASFVASDALTSARFAGA